MPLNSPAPEQRVVLVTGSSRGIGRGIAEELGRLGLRVVVNYVRDAAAAETVVRAIVEAGGEALAVQSDVGALADHERLVAAPLERWGRLDVLVNNAGITSVGRLDALEASESSWDQVMATNLKGPFFLTQRVARAMLGQGTSSRPADAPGLVVNISSISAYAVSLNRADYCIAKAGMGMMTSVWAARLADLGIQVFEICPGVIASDMTAPVQAKYDALIAEGLSPIRRWGTPEDVAQAVSAIVRGHFPFSTGMRLHVDGGYHLRRL
jgi:NAD(P)-dependent dehydrogenase (short-subunit alcohol dehydrogenase family)